jgi:hypothetical protein
LISKAAKLIVTEGATFQGHCSVGPNAAAGGPAAAAPDAGNRIAGKQPEMPRK